MSSLPYADSRAEANSNLRAGNYAVQPAELDYDQTAALPGAEDRAKATAQAAAGIPPTAPPAPMPQRSLDSVEAAITGAPSPKPVPQKPPLEPHQFEMTNYDDVTKLQAAARAGGIDVDKIPPKYWQDLSDRYAAAHDPDTVDKVTNFIKTTAVGHFMQGWDDSPRSTYGQSAAWHDLLSNHNPTALEVDKADRYFNANIQRWIIDKGQYVDKQGNYNPPASYQAGKALGGPDAAYTGLGILGAATGLRALAGPAKMAVGWAQANPIPTAALLYGLSKGNIFGAAMRLFGE
jgi:hypothetical protein